MQLMPATARGLGVNNAFDPAQAVNGAAKLLASHLREFKSVPLALAAYNAGGGAVHRYDGIPPFAETQAYVPKVQKALAALGG
jgi:soluble lytic murein transglycosylase-like protein